MLIIITGYQNTRITVSDPVYNTTFKGICDKWA